MYFVQQPALFTAYIDPLDNGLGLGYEPIAFQCELVKIFNARAKPVLTWQYIETDSDPIFSCVVVYFKRNNNPEISKSISSSTPSYKHSYSRLNLPFRSPTVH